MAPRKLRRFVATKGILLFFILTFQHLIRALHRHGSVGLDGGNNSIASSNAMSPRLTRVISAVICASLYQRSR